MAVKSHYEEVVDPTVCLDFAHVVKANPIGTGGMEGTQMNGYSVSKKLASFVNSFLDQHGNACGIDKQHFWASYRTALDTLGPRIESLLEERRQFQTRLEDAPKDTSAHVDFLKKIGYIEPSIASEACCSTENADPEISSMAGPQLVVPLSNARYVLNAINSRWMSLYDCLYASDILEEGSDRAQACVDYAMMCLDRWIPLQANKWTAQDVNNLGATSESGFTIGSHPLVTPCLYVGSRTEGDLTTFYFKHNDLHVGVAVNRSNPLGSKHPYGISDVLLESAITTIVDGEDSVAVVDESDKIELYQNWKALLVGSLEASFEKNGKTVSRRLHEDIHLDAPAPGNSPYLSARGIILARIAGLHIATDIVQTENAERLTSESITDAFVFGLIGYAVDVAKKDRRTYQNSKTGSVYLVAPKMHGSNEVKLMTDIFEAVEKAIGAPAKTLKIGIMDEERRTSFNLANCIYEARDRVVFINTGFLDRTGDNISTLMNLGAVPTKSTIKNTRWLEVYEDRNVTTGLACGLHDRAQIGKGMWPAPDAMKALLEQKVGHAMSGATTAWVPSPTGACVHAIHYHDVDVQEVVRKKCVVSAQPLDDLAAPCFMEGFMEEKQASDRNIKLHNGDLDAYCRALYDILIDPSKKANPCNKDMVADILTTEVFNNVQCIVGYASRWIILGIGCSKIPDMSGVGLMEDRATLRISSQHLANWLHHRIVTQDLVEAAVRVVASAIDERNKSETGWVPIGTVMDQSITPAMKAIRNLCFHGRSMENGYTEPTLYLFRRLHKSTYC